MTFIAMASVVLIGGAAMIWYAYQFDRMFETVISKELVLYKAAQDMELALANQKGFLTYYLVDGDAKWLNSLGEYRQIFKQSLLRAEATQLTDKQKNDIAQITSEYNEYIAAKDLAIQNYQQSDERLSVSAIHMRQRSNFFSLLERCRQFSNDQWQAIKNVEEASQRRSAHLRGAAFGVVLAFMVLGGLFLYIIYRQILAPIRGLAIETGSTPQESSKDEVLSLRRSLKGMMRDFDETHDELTRSRKHLLQAERMAMVGELAAGVAHTIRNPFTSIKMRMFSLSRSLTLDDIQNEDLQVISDEIGRIDRIVQNFLEFARPPKLSMAECSLASLINSVIKLLEYRLRVYNVEIDFQPKPDLASMRVDADRIKEALVNLITNACEAMATEGRIEIDASRRIDPELGDVAVISVCDDGPGIPPDIIHKVTTPFFTTKEDGSGLGLSIVERIVREHRGRLTVTSELGQGAVFTIMLPIISDGHEQNSDH